MLEYSEIFCRILSKNKGDARFQRNSTARFYGFAQYLYLFQKSGNLAGKVQNQNFLVVVKDCSIALNHTQA